MWFPPVIAAPDGSTKEMSTLTALQLQRDLDVVRLAASGPADRPKLSLEWTIDATGRPVGVWTVVSPVMTTPVVTLEPAFA
jgi:hypothetical protein